MTPDVIKGVESDRIDAGAVRGANLFHSFQEFNVREGRGAYFSNPAGVESIFSRVTGTNPSNILGTLGVLGNANLFLLNPNGIIFGPNAKLDVSGSFSASTANSLSFGDQEFSATNPAGAPLLTVKVPLGVQFNKEQPGAIANSGNLSVGTGHLNLLGGTVISTGQLSAPEGQISVASVPGNSVVNLNSSTEFLNIDTAAPGNSGDASSLVELLTSSDDKYHPGLTVKNDGQVELAGSGLTVADGDVVARNVTGKTATLTANRNLTLVESQLGATGDLNLLARDTVRVRDSVANPFVAQAGGNLTIRGDRGIDILALNHPQTPFVSGGNLSLMSDGIISGDAHFFSGGNFSILNLSGGGGNFISLYDPIIRSNGDVEIGEYRGASLMIESRGNIRTGAITINRPDDSLTLSDVGNDQDLSILRDGRGLILRSGTDTFSGGVLEPPLVDDIPSTVNYSEPSVEGSLTIDGNITSDFGGPLTVILKANGDIGSISTRDINSTVFSGDGGNISITANGDITTGSLTSFVDTNGQGNAGEIQITSNTGNITIGGSINSESSNGTAGNVTLRAAGNIRPGNIEASSNTNDQGFSTIRLESSEESVFLNGVTLSTTNTGSDYAGHIDIIAPNGKVEITDRKEDENGNETSIRSEIKTDGYFGIINIDAGGDVFIKNSIVSAQTQRDLPRPAEEIPPQSGDINITSQNGNIDISNNSSINSSTSVRFDDQPQIDVNAGNINIEAKNGSVSIGSPWSVSETDRSQVLSRNSRGRGNAGNVTIKAERGTVTIAGIRDNGDATVATDVANKGLGNGGELTITGRSVDIKDEAIVAASIINGNGGEGENGRTIAAQAGNVNITATDTVSVNNSVVFSEIGSSSVGNGGKVNVTAPKVDLDNVAFLVTIVRQGGQGKGGEININTDSLSLKNGSLLATSTSGDSTSGVQGGAGNVTIRGYNTEASNTVFIDGRGNNNKSVVNIPSLGSNPIPSAILSTVEAAARSENNGGNIDILTGSLEVTNSGRVSATNFAQGRAGNVVVGANSVLLRGTNANTDFRTIFENNQAPQEGLLAEATNGGTAGDLFIFANELRVENGAAATVSSPDGQAGNLVVFAKEVFLNNGALLAKTGREGSELGANIFLLGNEGNETTLVQSVADLLLLISNNKLGEQGKKSLPGSPLDFLILGNESRIATDAENSANGGNIAIKTRLLLALPPTGKNGNDISANALKTGNGGVVAIDPRPLGIYGTEFRPKKQNTPLNDITASSAQGSQGTVAIVPLDVDPRRGILQLPEDLGDSSRLITKACPVGGRRATSKFVVTGRGGLPPNPGSALSSDAVVGNTTANIQQQSTPAVATTEAQGVNFGPNGEIIFTARPSQFTPYSPWQRFRGCYGQ